MNENQQILVQRGEDALAAGGEHVPSGFQTLPQSATKEKKVVLVLSFESEEERAALVESLGIAPSRRWTATWPPGDEDLRLDV